MTDKQIIIDVSDCSELCGTKCHILMSCTNTSKSDSCSEMPNCYYKQLKRKEQECEFSNFKIIQLQETLSQYETDLSTKDCIVETCKAQYKELKAERDSYIDKYFLESQKVVKLSKALKEIKEIARVGAFYWKHYKEESKRYNEILQKISEVEDEKV